MTLFISTRGNDGTPKSFTQVLLAGMATDGGLYVPLAWPALDVKALRGLSYPEIAYRVMKPFTGDCIPEKDLKAMINEVYAENFTHAAVAPLVQLGTSTWVMELFHGPTLAFKDYALQLVGRLFDYVLTQSGERITIVGATSGDTGSAAIAACMNCSNIDIFILHPEGRTSEVQRRQMTSVDCPNVHNIALQGTFDDCQNAVKTMFADEAFRKDLNLSAVNSINWARIMAQIVYYVSAAVALGAPERKISFAVPTGNFGNIYAAYGAKKMGLDIERLVIGSNRNDILTRFFETGVMQAAAVEASLSPSMDIQVSSNFERYLFDLLGRDPVSLRQKMESFRESGRFDVAGDLLKEARAEFGSYRCDDEATLTMMRECYQKTGYVLDPHTAVGFYAASKARLDPAIPVVALACAHPAKFPDAVRRAINITPPLPAPLSDLYERKEKFSVVKNDLEFLKTHIRKTLKK
jgi:threonine synthase